MITERFTEEITDYTVSIKNGEIESIRNQEYINNSIRVFLEDNKLGIASAIGQTDDEILKNKALINAKLGFTYDYELEEAVHYECTKGDHELVDLDFLINTTRDLLNKVKSLSDKFIYNGKFSASRTRRTLNNSESLLMHLDKSQYSGFFDLKRIGSPDILDGYVAFDSFFKIEQPDFINEADLMINILTSDVVNLNLNDLEVAFLNREILGRLSGNINGEAYNQGTSVLSGKLDTQIMRDDVNIYEVFEKDDESIYVPFDHEGIIRNHDVPIVKNGVLSNLIFDKKQAKKYNTKTTGNGFRSFNTHPVIACRPLIPELTMDTLKNYSNEKTLLVPFISSGGDFLPNGDFSFPIQLAFFLKNGKIIGKAPQLTLTGNYLKAMNEDLIGIAENDLFNFSTSKTAIICKLKISEN